MTTLPCTITFIDKGAVATTARDVVYVGVGQHLMPGVLDHKATDAHLRGFRGATDIVLKEPALYREHLARTRADDLLILTNNDPDLDAALACYLICHWKTGGARLDEAAVAAAARYVADAKRLWIDVRPDAPEALEHELLVVFEAMKRLADEQHATARGRRHAQRAALDHAFSLFEWLLTRPPARGLLRDAPGLDDVRRTIRADRERYQRDRASGMRLNVPLLQQGARKTVSADVLAVEEAESFLFALWAYYDFATSSPHGFAVAIQRRRDDHAVELAVSPNSVVHLRRLGSRLEQKEKEVRKVLGRERLGPPRPGYDTADPWFDGRGTLYEDRLVAGPGAGTVLTFQQILDEFTEYAKFSPAEIEASVDEVQGLEHFSEAEQAASRALLRKLFLGKDGPKLDDRRLRVVRRFGEGQSGAHVLEVDAAVGPGVRSLHVVKLGPRGLIEQEWQRWQAVQAHTGGGRAWATPIVAFREDGGDRAGLIYAHARAWGGGAPTSLKQFALEALARPDRHARLLEVVLQLFDQVEGVFHVPEQAAAIPTAFYDQRLVPNLVLEVTDGDVVDDEPTMPLWELLESTHDEARAPKAGTTLVVGGLEVLSDEGAGKVRCRGEGGLGGKLDLRANGRNLPRQPGESVRPLRGKVVSSRAAQLAELAGAACAPTGGLHALLGERLASPLEQVQALLRLPSDYHPHAMSHGDLNTENVLLLGHLSSPMLIDWASTGPDQPLVFDFVKLEVELRTHVFAPFHERGELDVTTWRELELRLAQELGAGAVKPSAVGAPPLHARAAEVIATIRDRALARVPDVRRADLGREYLRGVALYALSTLKFGVSAAGKRLALLAAAAATQELLGGPGGKGDVVRVSTSAFGIAKLVVDGTPRYLVQWNSKWKAFNLIAGHVEHELDQGFFDRGMLREAREELPTLPAERIHVRALPVDLIETTRRSAGYDGLTRYVLRVFQLVFDLDRAEVLSRTSERPENAWITEEELRCGRTADGRDVTRFPIAEILHALPAGALCGLDESVPF